MNDPPHWKFYKHFVGCVSIIVSYLLNILLIELKSRTINNIVIDFSLNQGSFVPSGRVRNFFFGGRVVTLIY